jgi:class 3 adenylate cyclase
LKQLEQALETASAGRPQLVVVHGDPGAGKSRLVGELIARTVGSGGSHVGHCGHLRAPYAPIAMLLSRALADGRLEGPREEAARGLVRRLTSAEAASLPGGDEPEQSTARVRLFLELSEALTDLVADRATILVIEDLHWIDPSSAKFLEFFALGLLERAPRLPLLLIFTRRTREGTDRSLERLEQRPDCLSMPVKPLNELEVHDLIRGHGVPRPGRQLVSMLHGASAGNPLHVQEILRRLHASDAFTEQHWRVEAHASSRELSAPTDLTALIDRRLEGVTDDVLELLRLASIVGEEFEPGMWAPLHGGAVAAAIDEAVDAGFFVERGDRLAFAYPLLRQVVYDGLSRRQRRSLHGRVAAALRETDDAFERAREIAHHLLESGAELDGDCLEYIWRAGLQDHRVAAWRSAIRYFDAAIALGERLKVPPATLGWFRFWAGRSRREDYDAQAALELLREAAEIGREVGDIELWSRSVNERIGHELTTSPVSQRGEIDTTDLDAVIAQVGETRPDLRGPLLASYCTIRMTAYDSRAGLAMGEEALRLAHAASDPTHLARAESTLGMAFLGIGDAPRACEHLERAEAIAGELRDRETEAYAAARRGLALWMLGRTDEAERATDRAAHGFDAVRHRSGQCLVAAIRAALAILRGDFAAGERWGQESEALYEQSQYYFAPLILYPSLIDARTSLGDDEGAASGFEAWRATGQGGRFLTRLVALVRCGRLDEARERLENDPRPLLLARVPSMVSIGMIGALTETAHGLGDTELAARLEEILNELPDHGAILSPGSNHLLPWCRGVLAGLQGETERAVKWLEQSVVAAQAAGALPELARSHLELGRLLSLDDERAAEAARCLGAALDVFERLGMTADAEFSRRLLSQLPPLPIPSSRRPTFLLMSDLVSSTRISVEQGDRAYLRLLDLHNEILRVRLRDHGGVEVDTAGDGMLARLESAEDAVRCALAVQRDVERHAGASDGPRLALRIGLAAGEPIERAGRLYGSAVNLAARLCAVAEPGQIVMPGDFVQQLPPDLDNERLGELLLKGFSKPIDVYSVRRA